MNRLGFQEMTDTFECLKVVSNAGSLSEASNMFAICFKHLL